MKVCTKACFIGTGIASRGARARADSVDQHKAQLTELPGAVGNGQISSRWITGSGQEVVVHSCQTLYILTYFPASWQSLVTYGHWDVP